MGAAEVFEVVLDYGLCVWGGEEGEAVVAAEGDEVELVGLLVALQALEHGWRVRADRTFGRWPTHGGQTAMNGAPGLRGGSLSSWVSTTSSPFIVREQL